MNQDPHKEAFLQALAKHQSGQVAAAEELCRGILGRDAGHGPALHLLGVILAQTGRYGEAGAVLGRAGAALPQVGQVAQLEGRSWAAAGEFERAAAAYERALKLAPRAGELQNDYGNVLRNLGRLEAAARCFGQALEMNPRDAVAWNRMGLVREGLGEEAEALRCYREALALRPEVAEIHLNAGALLARTSDLDGGIAELRRAAELRPDYAAAWYNLGNARKDSAEFEEAIRCYRRALELNPGFIQAHSNLLVCLNYHAGWDDAGILRECRRWNEAYARPLAGEIRPWSNERSPERRLRIGYVSADFRAHASANFLMPLLAGHDHQRAEVFCYAQVARPDAVTERLRGHADQWRSIVGQTDAAVAEQIRSDGIDILVDLKLHTDGHRLLVFARKPAPVQVTWLGYPGTTGLEAMDYRLTDPYLDPPGRHDEHYVERSVRLPESFWCYDPLMEPPAVGPLPASVSGGITFGCLNDGCKLNEGVIAAWGNVLQAVGGSRLLVLARPGRMRRWIVEQLRRAGVEAGRVEFTDRLPRKQYLELYRRIDIGLDPFPCNGHTTTLEARWMGVPVVSLCGEKVVGRAGFSQLSNLGLQEWVAWTPGEYVALAAALAGDVGRLGELRAGLRGRMQGSALMDGGRFCAL